MPLAHEFRHAVLAGLASDDVTQDRLDTLSYIDTVRKHGKSAGASLAGGVPQLRTALRKHG